MQAIQETGGILTMQDMKNYKVAVREPLTGYYHGRKIITGEAPSRLVSTGGSRGTY